MKEGILENCVAGCQESVLLELVIVEVIHSFISVYHETIFLGFAFKCKNRNVLIIKTLLYTTQLFLSL